MESIVHWISFFLISFASFYSWHMTSKHKHAITSPIGMRTAMVNAMMSSLIVGTILGIIVLKMFIPTVTGVLVGMSVGYITGRNFGLPVIMDAFMSGIMGGAMGAMLGVMMMGDHQVDIVLFLDFLYAFMMISIWKWSVGNKVVIKEEQPLLQSKIAP